MRFHPPKLVVLAVAVLASVLLLAVAAHAQRARGGNRDNNNNNNNPDATPGASPTGSVSPAQNRFWRCELPGGVYLVALPNIQSISTHEYVVDGAARVTEVTVATASSVEGRFYYLEPITPSAVGATLQQLQQHVQDLAASHVDPSDQVWQKVVKTYPATTHAHTVEYRLSTKENLQQLYSSLETSWMSGRGASMQTQ